MGMLARLSGRAKPSSESPPTVSSSPAHALRLVAVTAARTDTQPGRGSGVPKEGARRPGTRLLSARTTGLDSSAASRPGGPTHPSFLPRKLPIRLGVPERTPAPRYDERRERQMILDAAQVRMIAIVLHQHRTKVDGNCTCGRSKDDSIPSVELILTQATHQAEVIARTLHLEALNLQPLR